MNLVIVGDQAYTAPEWERLQRRREKDRTRYHTDPERRAKVHAAAARWNRSHPERIRELHREHMNRRRADPEYRALELVKNRERAPRYRTYLVGSLHTLACSGPTVAAGCVCARRGTRKIRCYDKP